MGVGLRRFNEKVRQAAGIGGKSFQPTSNLRNESMLREAVDFSTHLRKCDKAIADMKHVCDIMLTTTKGSMGAPLPHVFEETAAGAGSEVRPTEAIGGPAFQGETVTRLSQQASAQIESQVLVPIKRWLEVFSSLQTRMKETEELRLEVDSRRHTVIDLAATVDKQRAKLAKLSGADAKLEGSLDDTIKKLQHKEGKLALVVQNYQEKEQSLYTDLSTLIKDAAWLKHYLASALRVQGEALSGAARALGDTRPESSIDVSSLSLGGSSQGNAPAGSQQQHYEQHGGSVGQSMSAQGTVSTSPQSDYRQSADGAANPFLASGVIRE